METIKDTITRTTELAKKLKAENPGLVSVSFEFDDFPLVDMEDYVKEKGKQVEFSPARKRFHFCQSPDCGIYIHIYSVGVKAKLVYDEVANGGDLRTFK